MPPWHGGGFRDAQAALRWLKFGPRVGHIVGRMLPVLRRLRRQRTARAPGVDRVVKA